jgi:hypothetical protein
MFIDFIGTSAWCLIDGRGRDEDPRLDEIILRAAEDAEGAAQTPTATE